MAEIEQQVISNAYGMALVSVVIVTGAATVGRMLGATIIL